VASAVGYTGGDPDAPRPTYRSVCAMNNTFTEALRLEIDTGVLSYEALVRQYLDEPRVQSLRPRGTRAPQQRAQTRFAIWAQDEEQAATARRVLSEAGKEELVAVLPASEWHEAEEEHQHFIRDEKDFADWSADPDGDEYGGWETGPGTAWGL
jgi:peptide methionine sulfoxide reductase MsrA